MSVVTQSIVVYLAPVPPVRPSQLQYYIALHLLLRTLLHWHCVVTLTLHCYIRLLHCTFHPRMFGEQLRVAGDGSHQSVVSVVPLTVHMLPVTITTPPPYFHISTLSPNIFKYSTIQGKISIRLQQLWRRCGAEFMECPPLHLRLDTVPFLPSLLWWLQCSPGTRYNCLEVSTECK